MPTRKKTHFAVLGLLSWKPMSGYDIKKIVDIGLSHFWNENYGQIYPTLNSLVKEGLARKSLDRRGSKRKRYVYRITPEGVQSFRDWLDQPTAPPITRNERQLKFFLSSNLSSNRCLKIVTDYQRQQKETLREYRESEVVLRAAIKSGSYPVEVEKILEDEKGKKNSKQMAKQCSVFLLTLRHGILAIEARLAWCTEAVSYFSKGK